MRPAKGLFDLLARKNVWNYLDVSKKRLIFAPMIEREMKREMGKWLMDVAKYMFTALLLSTVFSDMADPIILFVVVILTFAILFWGWIVYGNSFRSDNEKKGK